MSELSADRRPEVVAAAPEPATEATGQQAATELLNATGAREGAGAATMVYRKTARHEAPSWRVPGSLVKLTLLAAAVLGVAAVVYLVMPESSGGRSAATALGSGATAAARSGTAAGGQQGQPGPPPGSAAQQGVPGPAFPPQTGPKPLKPADPGPVKSWNAGSGGKALAQVTTLSGNVLMTHGLGQYPQMLRYCTGLATAVQAAENAPPIPDAAMQQMYAAALNAFKQGAADCMAGITQHHEDVEETVTNVNHATVNRAVSELGVGMRDLYIGTNVLRRI